MYYCVIKFEQTNQQTWEGQWKLKDEGPQSYFWQEEDLSLKVSKMKMAEKLSAEVLLPWEALT